MQKPFIYDGTGGKQVITPITSSSGASDSGKLIATNIYGKIDTSMIPDPLISETVSIGVIGEIKISKENLDSDYWLPCDYNYLRQSNYPSLYNIIQHEYKVLNKATQISLPVSANWHGVVANDNIISVAGYGSNSLITSLDGVNWTSGSMPSSDSWVRGAYAKELNLFVMVCYGSATYATSTDGITWTGRSLPVSANWHDIVWGNNLFIIVANNSTVILTSSDGINWTSGSIPNSREPRYIAYGNGYFLITSNSGYISYSIDGINWSEYYFGNHDVRSIRYFQANKKFYTLVNFTYALCIQQEYYSDIGYCGIPYYCNAFILPREAKRHLAFIPEAGSMAFYFDRFQEHWGNIVMPTSSTSYNYRVVEEFNNKIIIIPENASLGYILEDMFDDSVYFRLPKIENGWIRYKQGQQVIPADMVQQFQLHPFLFAQ